MASCLNGTVHFDIFYFIAFTLRFSLTCQVQADTFAGQRQFPVKVKGKTLVDFHSVIVGLKLVRILSFVSTQQTGGLISAFCVLPLLELGFGFVAVLI